MKEKISRYFREGWWSYVLMLSLSSFLSFFLSFLGQYNQVSKLMLILQLRYLSALSKVPRSALWREEYLHLATTFVRMES